MFVPDLVRQTLLEQPEPDAEGRPIGAVVVDGVLDRHAVRVADAAHQQGRRAGRHGEERRFLISPRDTAACMKRAREAGMNLVGVYHTHPNHPAVPSDFDRDAAWPEWSYIIVSVRDGRVADFRSWGLTDDGSRFDEEAVTRL